MILKIYTSLGIYLFFASKSPATFKPLISWFMWGGNLCHGVVALIHCFDASGPNEGSGRYLHPHLNMDKLVLAVPLWFGCFAGNLFFSKRAFGSFLPPWSIEA